MSRHTRRGVLGLLGSAALAGCGSLSDSEPVELDATALRDAVSGDPTVPAALPVDVGGDYRDSVQERVAADLASVPDPLTAEDVPNGAVRGEFARFREDARTELDAAAAAEPPVEALGHLRDAREEAAALAAGWAFTRGAFGVDELGARRTALGGDAEAFAATWSYVGEEPVRATVVHAAIEDRHEHAANEATRTFEREGRALALAEAAGEAAAGRTALSEARHLDERFRASLAEPRNLSGTIETAAESLAERARERAGELPEDADPGELVDGLDRRTPAWHAVEMAYNAAIEPYLDDAPAGRLLDAVGELADVAAFESVRSTLASDPAAFDVTSAEDVAAVRERAVDALRDGLGAEHAALARPTLESAGSVVAYADSDVRRVAEDGPVAVDWVDRQVAYYAHAAALARAAPDAAAQGAAALTDA